MAQETDDNVRRLLGGRTITEFARLSADKRKEIFRRHLVQDELVIIDECENDDLTNPEIAQGVRLRQEYFMGNDDVGKQLVKEATETYYNENDFFVRLHWLCEFMIDTLGDDGTRLEIAPLVRGAIVVQADLGSHVCTWNTDDHSLLEWTRDQLEDLFKFDNAAQITLVLSGGGLLDGSDLLTHRTLEDITPVVKRLIDKHGQCFDITKKLSRDPYPSQSLRSYWNAPSLEARRSVRRGSATFEHLMQVEIEEWTRQMPKIVGQDMFRERLL